MRSEVFLRSDLLVNKYPEKPPLRPYTQFSPSYATNERKNLEVSTNMQDNKPCDGKELICINVDKVYDWVVKEMSFDIPVSSDPIRFSPEESVPQGPINNATVTCEVTPDKHCPVVSLGREDRPFCIDGTNVTLQRLNIRKNFDVRIFVRLESGILLTSKHTIPVSRCEQVALCAPAGTDVEVTYTNLDCFVCTTGTLTGTIFTPGAGGGTGGTIEFSNLTISVSTCQSIQSTFPVTVEFLADFCEPRADLASACSPPSRPRQCPSLFPDAGGNCCG